MHLPRPVILRNSPDILLVEKGPNGGVGHKSSPRRKIRHAGHPAPSRVANFAAPPEVDGQCGNISPLPEARKYGLSLKAEPLMGPAEAPSISDRAGCARRYFKLSSGPGECASA
jgi:hypothetical protein